MKMNYISDFLWKGTTSFLQIAVSVLAKLSSVCYEEVKHLSICWSFWQMHNIGNNANIGIRGFTMHKKIQLQNVTSSQAWVWASD